MTLKVAGTFDESAKKNRQRFSRSYPFETRRILRKLLNQSVVCHSTFTLRMPFDELFYIFGPLTHRHLQD